MDEKEIKGLILFAVCAICVSSVFLRLDKGAMGNHEAYVAVTARQMLQSGEWVVPKFNGEVRLQKTPLCYWLVAGAEKITGSASEFVVRLPGALLAVLSAFAVFYFVSERLGFRTAVISTFVWSTTVCYIRYSHTARPEMTLCSFVAIAMLSFYSAIKTESRRKQIWFMLIFWISFALAMLAKGPAPLPLIAPALFLYFLFSRQWKLVPKLLPIAGTILFLLIVLPWPIAVVKHLPNALEIWNREFISRAEGEYAAGSKPFYYYFKVIFVHFLPYSAFIPLAAFAPFYKIWEKRRDAIWYHWLWFFGGIAVMSLCGGKRQHYILPVMPAMAVMAGIIIDDMIFVRKAYEKKFVRNFLIGHLIALVVVPCVLIFAKSNLESKEVTNNYSTQRLVRQFMDEAAGTEIIAYCNVNPSFIYYYGKDVHRIYDINDVYIRYTDGTGIFAMDGNYERLKKDGRFNLFIKGSDNERGLFLNK